MVLDLTFKTVCRHRAQRGQPLLDLTNLAGGVHHIQGCSVLAQLSSAVNVAQRDPRVVDTSVCPFRRQDRA